MQGDDFSPKHLVIPTSFSANGHEKGDIGNRGRYRGIPNPYGAIYISGEFDDIIKYAQTIKVEELRIESFVLSLDIAYKDQCNFEFSPSELLELSKTGATLAISCYEEGES